MSVTSNRSVTITFTGDLEYSQSFTATSNPDAVGQIQIVDLVTGNNTITVSNTDQIAVTILPPADNTNVLKVKGVAGDTGIIIDPTDPTSIGLSGVSTFVINVSANTAVRLIYT